MSYTMTTTVKMPFPATVTAVRDALAGQGFGVLTEIDLQATLKTKLDVDILPHVILGACRPPLAYAALLADPAVGALLPCNVVVRSIAEATTTVDALDPDVMVTLSGGETLREVATEAKQRLAAVLDAVKTGLADQQPTSEEH